MKVIKGYPPNYAELRRVFPIAGRTDIIFAYGDCIYRPSGMPLPAPLIAHEQRHGERQEAIGVENWWRRYIDDIEFRFAEELLGHKAEWQHFIRGVPIPSATQQREMMAKISSRLAGPLYGSLATPEQARQLILGTHSNG